MSENDEKMIEIFENIETALERIANVLEQMNDWGYRCKKGVNE